MFWTGLSMALMSTVYNVGSVILQSSINALGNIYITAQVGGKASGGAVLYAGACTEHECCNLR